MNVNHNMNVRRFRELMNLPENTTMGAYEIEEIISQGDRVVTNYLSLIKDCVILYEGNRKIGDKEQMNYYKNKLLGKLGLI